MNDHFQNSIIDTMGHRNTRALGHSAMYVVDMVRIPGNKKGASFGGAHELSFRICTHKHLIKGACSIELKEVCFRKLLTKNSYPSRQRGQHERGIAPPKSIERSTKRTQNTTGSSSNLA